MQKKWRKIFFENMFFLGFFLLFFTHSNAFASVVVTEDQTIANKFTRHTVTGITTPAPVLPDVTGFPGASYLTIGDIDKDGVKEIICTSGTGIDGDIYSGGETGAVAIFKRSGSGLDSWTQAVINQTFAFPNETALRDMDGDGDFDIMVMDNFIVAWYMCGKGGIYWLENLGGDMLQPSNWIKHTIYIEPNDGTGTQCPCAYFCAGGVCPETKCNSTVTSYHRARFVDLDGDGREDFVTTKVHMWYWQWTSRQFAWMEWYKKEIDTVAYPSGFSGPYQIGEGGGFLFEMADIDGDGNLDIVAPQFFIFNAGFVREAPGDPDGDSLIWFSNPGKAAIAANHNVAWNRYTIDNEWTSPNTIGKGMEAVPADIDNDGVNELVVTNHQHQQYSSYSGSPLRYWPAGVYYFEIPVNPASTSQWTPLTIETGNPLLDPNDHTAVLADLYAVDRDFNDYNGQGSPGMVRAQDITGDGFADLLVPGDGKGKLYYYESAGSTSSALNFKRGALYSDVGCMPGEAKFDDIDGDGDADVIAAIYDTRVTKDLNLPTTSASIFIFENTTPTCGNGILEFGEECEANSDCEAGHANGWTCSGCVCQEPTLINLSSFVAVAGSNKVTLKWATESEIKNAGFNIYRAESIDGPYININADLIPSKGSATQAASYEYVDSGVKNRHTYYYKLEDIDQSGASTMHGPESAAPRFFIYFR